VQLSRARHETTLYPVIGPEAQGPAELDLPDRDVGDGYDQLAQALSRAGDQQLAIDTPSSLDLRRLSTGVAVGIANDVTVQPDDRIVIAGRASLSSPRGDDFSDLLVARLLPDGQPDPSFGLGGQVVTDVGGQTNEAQNVVVLPDDGRILVSGSSLNPGSSGVGIDHHTDLARYLADGQPDPSFGTGGTLTLDGFVGADLVVQPDGRILLVGTADTTPPGAPPSSVTELSVIPPGWALSRHAGCDDEVMVLVVDGAAQY
jgi:uncharacterized delta-60 repeat protein